MNDALHWQPLGACVRASLDRPGGMAVVAWFLQQLQSVRVLRQLWRLATSGLVGGERFSKVAILMNPRGSSVEVAIHGFVIGDYDSSVDMKGSPHCLCIAPRLSS